MGILVVTFASWQCKVFDFFLDFICGNTRTKSLDFYCFFDFLNIVNFIKVLNSKILRF